MVVGNARNNETNNDNDNDNDNDNHTIPASRPLLIFNHNPKAGGGSILTTIRGFKSQEIMCHKSASNAESYSSGCTINAWKTVFDADGAGIGVDESFLHIGEFARTTHIDHEHGFVIGSIREPCSHYLSLWSWGSLGKGAFRKREVTNPELYGLSSPYFNTTTDTKRFAAWMKDPSVVGTVGNRIKASYGEAVLDTVDCWVFVEDFRETLLGCLRMYQGQGGFVNWEASTVKALLEKEDEEENALKFETETEEDHHHHRRNRKRRKMPAKKNDPLGDPRSSHHGKCQNMFDEATAKLVENRTERFVYELFGYEGCCKPGTNFYPNRASSLVVRTKNNNNNNNNNTTTTTTKTEAAKYATHPTNQLAQQQQQKQKQHPVVSSGHSVRVSNITPTNNNYDPIIASSLSLKRLPFASKLDWQSSPPITELYDGQPYPMDAVNFSSTVLVVATCTAILLLSFCRFLWKPRREETRY